MDDPELLAPLLIFAAIAILFLLRSVRQINQWETALKFTFGRYAGRLEPGLNIVIPIAQKIFRIDTRIRNRDLPAQMVITKDNVTAMIDAVVYYKVIDAEKAALNVENFETAVKDRARVVLRDIVGETTLDELLGGRDEVAVQVRKQVEQFVAQWGLHIESIALQDIQLPHDMQQAIARTAIAQRDKQYVIIKSQADVESARNFAEAARILTESPGALELRRLEALQGITGSGNTKVVFDLAKSFDNEERKQSISMATAMAEERTGVRVETGAPASAAKQQFQATVATTGTATTNISSSTEPGFPVANPSAMTKTE
ncbi:MAG: SPFH domain-containing protein [Deltaproteobacteria bacterium]|nr:SPFH domain-containing protein [Deltaproteobacteria bacterium]